MFFFSCSKLILITNGFIYVTLSLNRLAHRLLTICHRNERVTRILDKERCIKEQVYSGPLRSWRKNKEIYFYCRVKNYH